VKTSLRYSFVAFLGIAAMLVAACGSSSSTASNKISYDFSYNPSAAAKTGGTAIFADWQAPVALIPPLISAAVEQNIANALWDSCVAQLPDLTLKENGFKPDQCTEVPTVANGGESADGLTTTLKLDPNAKWSDGQPITPEDYILSWQYGNDPNILGGSPPWGLMKSVVKVDPTTVKVTWSSPYGPYLNSLPYPLPVHIFGQYDPTKTADLAQSDKFLHSFTVDNGPFTIQSFSPEQSVVLVKNPNFHSNFFKGVSLDKAIFKTTGDVNTLIEGYKAGNYDEAEDFTFANTAGFAGIPAKEQITSSNISFEHIDFNFYNKAPNTTSAGNKTGGSIFAGDKGTLVRKAFAEAFDKCATIQAILGQACNSGISTDENTAPPDPAYDPNVKLPAYNPSDARNLLSQAGYAGGKWPNGSAIQLLAVTTQGNPVRQSFLTAFATQIQKNLGIIINIDQDRKIFSPYSSGGILKTGAYDIALYAYIDTTDESGGEPNYTTAGIPGPDNPGGANGAFLSDPKVDQYFAQGDNTIGFDKRVPIYHDVQKYMTDQVLNIPLYIRLNYALAKPTLGNYKLYPAEPGNTWNIADWNTTANRAG
jgi:peptide/nickel transport system substrate-binding protein